MRSVIPGTPSSYDSIKAILGVVLCLTLSGCHSPKANLQPTIQFNRIPPASQGGPDKLETIAGRVSGARPGQQIVLFARAGAWWVQPMTDQPFTKIQPDSTWSSPTHLGFEYAALLVDPGYVPAPTMDSLPTQGGLVAAVATVKGGNAPPVISKSLQFSGYEWTVRNAISSRNGSPNKYETANAWTDPKGLLHLRIAREADQWTCSEVLLTSSFGYGTYLFFVRDVSHLQPAAALSIFTWDDLGVEQNHREMDIEISRWGDPENKNAQFVIQPFYVAENVSRFTVPAGPLTFSLRWAPGKATFESFRGYTMASKARPLAEHVFTSGVPTPGGESVHLNFCAFKFSKVPLQHEAEVVIEKVQYLP